MEKDEKIKVAITAGIAGVILLILILYIALSGSGSSSKSDEALLDENITEYASMLNSTERLTDVGTDASSEASSTSGEATNGLANTKNTSEYLNNNSTISGNCFYETNVAILKNVYKNVEYNVSAQLAELLSYWDAGNMDAVRELAHLERFEAMSYALDGTKDFYYYGETDEEGKPQGHGIAVYANDQYYCGEWKNGVRSGGGTWISFYPNYSTYVVKEHMYSGEFDGDLPNGEGQEHYDYNLEHMNDKDIYIQNAIGSFANGLYDGEMYLITVNNLNETTEWKGNCYKGTLEMVPNANKDKKGYIPVFTKIEDNNTHMYMPENETKNVGILGIISGGNLVK